MIERRSILLQMPIMRPPNTVGESTLPGGKSPPWPWKSPPWPLPGAPPCPEVPEPGAGAPVPPAAPPVPVAPPCAPPVLLPGAPLAPVAGGGGGGGAAPPHTQIGFGLQPPLRAAGGGRVG